MKLTPTIFLGSLGALAATFALAQESTALTGLAPIPYQAQAQAQEHEQEPRGSAAVPLRPFVEPMDAKDAQDAGRPVGQDGSAAPLDDIEIAERLSVHDLDAREAAFDEIARRAARDPEVRRRVKALSEDTLDIDLAFTARLVLREADRLASWGRAGSGFGGRALQTPNDPFEAMRQQVESIFGTDPFVDQFFSSDPFFSRPFGGRSGVFGVDPFSGGRNPIDDMRRRADELRKQFDEMHDRALDQQRDAQGQRQQSSTFSQKSSSMSVTSTPDGVRVEITEDDGSGPKTEVYEAPTMEALLDAHPELKGRVR